MKNLPLLIVLAALTTACGSDPAKRPAEKIVHTDCSADGDCEGDRCIATFPNGGLCTHECAAGDECPEGTVCADTEAIGGVCLFTCTTTRDCQDRVGSAYVCDTESNLDTGEDVRVCVD